MTGRSEPGVTGHLLVVVPPELAAGFRLAGTDTLVAAAPEEAAALLDRVLAEGERGIVAVYGPFFARLPADRRARLETSTSPVVMALPAGLGPETSAGRRARLAARLQRAIGFHVTFGEEEP